LTSASPIRISPWPVLAVLLLAAPAEAERRPGRPQESAVVRQALMAAEARATELAGRSDLQGVVLGVYSDRDGDRWERELDEIAALGAKHVLIVVQEAMTDVAATEIGPRDWLTPSTGRLAEVLAGARKRGLGIVLMPTLYIEDTGEGQWRGAIEPTDWPTWWRSYERFLLRYARQARQVRAEIFCAGSELCSTETRRDAWARLLIRLRRATPSLLSYSFNWDHLRQGRIADLFDVVGMNAYHDLAEGPGTPESRLIAAWEPIRADIESWRKRHGRPLLFTEVGYRSVQVAEREPWNYLWKQPYDGEAQARCYRAFLTAWADHPALAGCFFYSWRGEGGSGDTGYTPRGKPAEAVLRRWLSPSPQSPDPESGHEHQPEVHAAPD
jgi:hypothetical protein